MKIKTVYLIPIFSAVIFSSCEKNTFPSSKKENLVDYVELHTNSSYEGKFQFFYNEINQVEEIVCYGKDNQVEGRIKYQRNLQNKNLEIKQFDKNGYGNEYIASHSMVFATNKIDSIVDLEYVGDKIVYNYQNSKLVSTTHYLDGDVFTQDYVGKFSTYSNTIFKDNHDFIEPDRGWGLLGNTIDEGLIQQTIHPDFTVDYLYVLKNGRVEEKESIYTFKGAQQSESLKYIYFYKK